MSTPENPESVEEPPNSKKAKWRRLDDIVKVRQALAAVIKGVYDGRIQPDRGSVCVTGLKALASIIYDADIERRLRLLESRDESHTQ